MPGVAPSNTYPCADREWVVIGGNADGIFHRLMTAIGRPDLAKDERFQDNSGRAANSKLLDDAIASSTSRTDPVGRGDRDGRRIGAGRTDLLGRGHHSDPHFRDRGMLLELEVEVEQGVSEAVTFPGIVPSSTSSQGA